MYPVFVLCFYDENKKRKFLHESNVFLLRLQKSVKLILKKWKQLMCHYWIAKLEAGLDCETNFKKG